MRPLVIDNFAGGGGASTGIEAALGRAVDIAINHDPEAVAMHAANHPATRHFCQSIMAVDPMEATGGAPVALAWFSPDCKHHSKAKGGKPVEKGIRDLAWIVVHWAERLRKSTPGGSGAPAIIMLENVEEFRQWGPLTADNKPDPDKRGETFDLWVRALRRQGYKVGHRELRACDYGAPTSRKRLFLIARREKLPIVWPMPTHGKPGSADVVSGKRLPWRTAAECIDWSIPCPSIFTRARPLKDTTHRRIAHGVMRYVVNAAKPFIVPLTHHGSPDRGYPVGDPFVTVTGAHRGDLAVVDATLAPVIVGCGGRRGQSGPVDPAGPYPTITAKNDACLTAALLTPFYGEKPGGAVRACNPVDEPMRTQTADPTFGLVEAELVQAVCLDRQFGTSRGASADAPIGAACAGSAKTAAVSAFLHKYRPNSPGASLDDPAPTVTANSFVKRPGGAPPISVVCAHMEQANTGAMVGREADKPLTTVTSTGSQQRLVETTMIEAGALPPHLMERALQVAAFLIKYYGNETDGHGLDAPIGTVTTKDRFAVITVTVDAITYVIVDIGMRMLTPRELARAQGFPDSYILDCPGPNGKPLTKSAQIRMIGNSVCPDMAEALVAANVSAEAIERVAA